MYKLNLWFTPLEISSGHQNPAGIILEPNAAAEQRGIISNGAKRTDS
jgi:hypothetical protein